MECYMCCTHMLISESLEISRNRIKSLPYVQEVIPEYQGQLQLNAMDNIENAQVMGMDPTKLTS